MPSDDRGRVALWHLPLSPDGGAAAVADRALLESFRAWLSPAERERQQRFRFEKDRARDLLTRGLVRSVLSRYAPVAPAHWRFATGAAGRLVIDEAHGLAGRLDFNLSHAERLIVLAVSSGAAVGVDLESLHRRADLSLADQWFSADEAAALHALPAAAQPRRLLELWTLKESYLKARGLGLTLPMDRFSFTFDGEASLRLQAGEAAAEADAARWRFFQWQTHGDQLLALCVDGAVDELAQHDLSRAGDAPPLHCVLLRRSPERAHRRPLPSAAGLPAGIGRAVGPQASR